MSKSVGQTITVRHDKKLGVDISLWYDVFGEDGNPPLLLFMGMNAQVTLWHYTYCQDLVKRGFQVYRVETRDIGKSTHLDHLDTHSICCLICCRCCVTEQYDLQDMALDYAAFIDKMFKPEQKVHILAQSMAGMISQILCSIVPERIATLNLLFTSPGAQDLPEPSLKVKLAMGGNPRDSSRQAYIDFMWDLSAVAFYPDVKQMEANKDFLVDLYGNEIFDRSTYKDMLTRHAAAVIKQTDRSEICRNIKIPTNVIHGDADVLVTIDHGKRLAKLIPGSKFIVIKGFGHGILPCHYDAINEPIAELAGLAPVSTTEKNNNVEPVAEAVNHDAIADEEGEVKAD